jgi:hypothetical protein
MHHGTGHHASIARAHEREGWGALEMVGQDSREGHR